MRSLQQSLACQRGPLLVSCFMVWPSCQEALDAPRLVCPPPVWPLPLNVDSYLMNRVWPQWSHLSPLRLGADSLWLPSAASRAHPKGSQRPHWSALRGDPMARAEGAFSWHPVRNWVPSPTDLRAEPCPQPPSNPGRAHRLPSQACSWDRSPGPHLDYSLWEPESEARGRAVPRFHTHADYGRDSFALKPLHFEVIWSMAIDN